jgi:hypothetical protein
MFMTCGQLKTDDKKLLQWLTAQKKEWMIVRVKVAGRTAFLRAGFGGKSGRHCHVDLAMADFFPKGQHPEPTHSKTDIQEVLDRLYGEAADFEVEAHFTHPKSELPRIIHFTNNMFKYNEDGVSIKMTGGKLSITGTPVYSITWALGDEDEDEEALLRFEAHTDATLDDSYMTHLFSLMNSAFRSFIRSGVPHVDG